MRLAVPSYPVDRYLVDSSKEFQIVNINDDLWTAKPALKPEDEIILRKLHDMLQSTAEDLKELTGELTEYHKPTVKVKTLPVPLDDAFNDKIHIEEVVNAKFHGDKLIERSNVKKPINQNNINNETFVKIIKSKPIVSAPNINSDLLVKSVPLTKKKNLSISRTRTFQIEDSIIPNISKDKSVKVKPKKTETVSYNEMFYKEEENPLESPRKPLQVQQMPSINIRSELRQQKVLQIDIYPETDINIDKKFDANNVVVREVHKEDPFPQSIANNTQTKYHQQYQNSRKPIVKKITMMSTCESSESSNNIKSDHQHILNVQKINKPKPRESPKRTKKSTDKKDSESKKIHFNLDEWKKKLNTVYGRPLSSRSNKSLPKRSMKRSSPKNKVPQTSGFTSDLKSKSQTSVFSNAAYVPYSKLTLGGVRVSDIEREISDDAIKEDIPLSPILDRILSSRDTDNTQKHKNSEILSTSDENLLKEVLDIGNKINKTLRINSQEDQIIVEPEGHPKEESESSKDVLDKDSYDDDFEEVDKSDNTPSAGKEISQSSSENNDNNDLSNENNNDDEIKSKPNDNNNITFTKETNLSMKDSIDIFEFVHSIETQENATQSQTTRIISIKETQTSPKHETEKEVSPPNNNPFVDVENMFKLEKELIKKLIVEEYGDLIEKNIVKPCSSSTVNEYDKNIRAAQKNTQTSPHHVKSIMTSPTRVKTRTTSPFKLNVTIDHQTSPLIFLNDKKHEIDQNDTEKSEAEDLGISINLSSPRFNLRLPQTSNEVISNLDNFSNRSSLQKKGSKNKESIVRTASTTSTEVDISSSELSSLGEIKLMRFKKRIRRNRQNTETSTSSFTSHSSIDNNIDNILPLRSEGEVSFQNKGTQATSKKNKNDERSFGQL